MEEIDNRRLDRIAQLESQLREANSRQFFLTLETARMAEENLRLQNELEQKTKVIAEIQGGRQY